MGGVEINFIVLLKIIPLIGDSLEEDFTRASLRSVSRLEDTAFRSMGYSSGRV